ncbi:MAG: (Fe-S)-binding protein [Candidatus Cloacimonetes bacterium]|nr:(Fe-S)-binding protein [Candidatus Cloacimonadota bacterium]
MNILTETIKKTNVYFCLDCGKCTSICPVALRNPEYSPRKVINAAVHSTPEEFFKSELLWECLTCKTCKERCPSDVYFSGFIRDVRSAAMEKEKKPECSHSGTLQTLMRIMTKPALSQNRLGWVTPNLKTSKESDYLYFVGCSPYLDAYFEYLDIDTIHSSRSAIKLLNRIGIEPTLLENERCCGHDLLWTGDVENFKKLAELNIEEIKKSGCKKIVVSCPECYNTLKVDYPKYLGDFGIEVIHITKLLVENLENDKLKFRNFKQKIEVTFQDPCRLGRYSGIYEEPRKLLEAIGKLEIIEMPRSRKGSICCGTSAWANCNMVSKQIQTDRLKEAKSTDADLLVTACSKCQIHFKCAMNDENTPESAKIKNVDLISLLADRLK